MSSTSSRALTLWLPIAGIAIIVVVVVALLLSRPDDGAAEAGDGATTTQQSAGEADGSAGGEGTDGADSTAATGDPAQDIADDLEPVQPDLSTVAVQRDPEEIQAYGPVDAPVVLVVFSDYQCGYCAKWTEETLPRMRELADAGDLRIEWHDVNIFGEPSERAARAAYAAGLQGAFWEYHDALYEGGTPRSASALSEDALATLASDLGLDTEAFAADMAAEETAQIVADHASLGLGLGVYSTPSFVIGNSTLVGAQPVEVFEDAVAAELARVG